MKLAMATRRMEWAGADAEGMHRKYQRAGHKSSATVNDDTWAGDGWPALRNSGRRFSSASLRMKTTRLALLLPIVFAAVFLLAACRNKDASPAGHQHKAPHGGTLIELGEHAYTVELLRDRDAGKLTAWVLDGHAENFVRITSPALELIAMPGGKFTPLSLQPVANTSTGEKIGDTSQFEIQADWLKTASGFAGILTIEIRGKTYEQVPYEVSD
jgi:hypothetical protein